MIENIKSFCKFLRYDESDGHWVARISENYFKHLEFYIAGDAKGINPILEKEAVRVIKNFSVVESIVKAYLAEIKSTIFESTTNLVVHFNHYPNTESLWEIMWLEFLDVNQLDTKYFVVSMTTQVLITTIADGLLLYKMILQSDSEVNFGEA